MPLSTQEALALSEPSLGGKPGRQHGGAIQRGDTMCLEVMGHNGSFWGTCDTVGVRKEGPSITFPVVRPGSQLQGISVHHSGESMVIAGAWSLTEGTCGYSQHRATWKWRV